MEILIVFGIALAGQAVWFIVSRRRNRQRNRRLLTQWTAKEPR